MVADVQLVVAALATSHKIGLAAVGVAFIVFALLSSFVFPRRSPNFPGRHLGVYVTFCALFFVAMIAAVLVFGKERSEASESPAKTATLSQSLPGQTTSAPTTTAKTTTTSGGGAATKGDPAAGKAVFASAGCSGCHTLKAANATGNVGPDLDQLKPAEDVVVHQVEHGGGAMPAFQGQLSAKQIQDVAAFVYASTH